MSFQGFQERNEIADLIGIEAELRHSGVPGDDAFGQRLLQRFDWIAFVQGPEGRRDLQRAGTDFVDGVTPRAIGQGDALALLRIFCGSRHHAGKQGESDENAARDGLTDQKHNGPLRS